MSTNSLNSVIENDLDLKNILQDNEAGVIDESSDYYEASDISLLDYVDSNLNVLHINIHSMPAKKELLLNLLNKLKTDGYEIHVILACETFMNENNIDECKIKGFNMEYTHRTNIARGGVAVYVNNKLKYKTRDDLRILHEGIMESCFVELITTAKVKNIVIGEVYRVPGTYQKE